MADENESETKAGFTIFRVKDSLGLMEAKCMTSSPFSPIQMEGIKRMVAAGYIQGADTRVLCNLPGFSMIYSWFKRDYPLPLHSHDSDCLYYIIAGDMKLGVEHLGPKDSLFVPAGVPYTFKTGADGVEFLEFRHKTQFDFVNRSKTEAFYAKAEDIVRANAAEWKTAIPPSQKKSAEALN